MGLNKKWTYLVDYKQSVCLYIFCKCTHKQKPKKTKKRESK